MIREGRIRLEFSYAPGAAASRSMVDEMIGALCAQCSMTSWPANSLCPTCGERLEDTVTVGPFALLIAITEVPDRGSFGLVKVDGTDIEVIHRIFGGAQPGDRLEPVFGSRGCEGFRPKED